MKPEKLSVQELFSRERRFIIPLFQRAYVWNQEEQWEPLWEDISRRAHAHLQRLGLPAEGKVRTHFLGAVVLNVANVMGRGISRSDVIDGQQRLTTLQLFLAALRDMSGELGADADDIRLFKRLTRNPDCEEGSEELFKVWPTNSDREVFSQVMSAGSPAALEARFPENTGGRPRMVQAYLFFARAIAEFIRSAEHASSAPDRFLSLVSALKESLQLIVIELEEGDDPQVIFETLNARGQPLLPSDLIRNYVFMRIGDAEGNRLYQTYWSHFDTEQVMVPGSDGESRFWHVEERQGRLVRPRIDLFIFHYLTMHTEDDIRIGHLFKEFRDWRDANSTSNEDFLKDLKTASHHFARLIAPKGNSRLEVFASRLRALDTSTVHPLLLFLASVEGQGIPVAEVDQIIVDLESYMVRRFICWQTPKNYNRFFLSLLTKVKQAYAARAKADDTALADLPTVAEVVRTELLRSQEASAFWPSDERFREGWLNNPVYVSSRADRSAMILRALGDAMTTSRNEQLDLSGPVTVEHLLPQKGAIEDYPYLEISLPQNHDEASWRKVLVNTVGNLTLLTGANNTAASNHAFPVKRAKIVEHSDLRLNAWLRTDTRDSWNETDILARGEELFHFALKIWPRPA
ncbi:protein of unknown function DUF1524 RloF [Novosphingobium aromaticivorans DSM 12444]|uniref:DUF262 domain-containing protein n=1 Tax=Novosphingobium aromaticivorans (strain ATCC 700278 / DSM 12444 / CCUG 56034 / CIP 105152 / NBRC 16084 / F199) TaxID=279238 RepID=Q2GBR5_NOVAD|nr:DUF262 domain-containing protein [Novosphingobium aromaticivorans]ABD24708.1 protein of unknown function DUF1524 RloF [Novosphingobium aromaticivorans DSM 12444]SCY19969.1 Protein of unknown function [Novosphingobium aromaticivorans]